MPSTSFALLGAENLAAAEGFAACRYAVGDSHILPVKLNTTANNPLLKQAYLISADDEDLFIDSWQSDENAVDFIKRTSQENH